MPGAKVTQVIEDNSFCSRRIYVRSAAVPPPSEWPTIWNSTLMICYSSNGGNWILIDEYSKQNWNANVMDF